VLCPHSHASGDKERPIDELLPPLTSSNEVDLQLYAIIAIVVKDLVYSWYGKITPDQTFVEEVLKIIAHCTRALETRLRSTDLESLLLNEIPELLEKHVQGTYVLDEVAVLPAESFPAYRISHQAGPSPALATNPRVIYHNLNPHPALSPIPDPDIPSTIEEQSRNEADYRQLLVQGALAVLLPTEDFENACLRTLVADVIAETILGNAIGGKVCEGWFIFDSIIKAVGVVQAKVKPKATGEQIEVDTRSRLEKFGLLSEKEEKAERSSHSRRSTLSSVFWRILQYGYLTFLAIRFVMLGFIAASSRPLRSTMTPRPVKIARSSPMTGEPLPPFRPRPILSFRIFPLLSTLLDLPLRMPWLCGSLALLQHHLIHGPLKVGGTDGILDQ